MFIGIEKLKIVEPFQSGGCGQKRAVPAPANTGLLRPPNTIVYFIPKYLYKLFCVVGAPDLFYRSYQCSAHLGSIQAGQVNVFIYLII